MKKLSEHRQWWLDTRSAKIKKKGHKTHKAYEFLTAPECMDFDDNSKKTLEYLQKLRNFKEIYKRFWIDFKLLKIISPSAALALLAEIDDLTIRYNTRLNIKDYNKWDVNIRTQLSDMGMFDILNINNRVPNKIIKPHDRQEGIKYFCFKKAYTFDIDHRTQLLNEIESFIKNNVPNRNELEVVISEAAANVANHAYDILDKLDNKLKIWWLSASYNQTTKELTVMFIDHGAGIPKMLEVRFYEYFTKLGLLLKPDAIKIQKATELGVSSTNQKNRGKGLTYIKEYVTTTDESNLRIISYNGSYKFNGQGEELMALKFPLEGTLIEWRIKV